jgi:lipoate-protein ligase A
LEIADGAHHMAADETLLESAASGVTSLRFYEWNSATVSLGYFQPASAFHNDNRLRVLPYVRRLTGGQTLVHHHELTYAIALPAGTPWQPKRASATSWLQRMHRIIADALGRFGVTLAAAAQTTPASDAFLCFKHVTSGDGLIGNDKVLGSSQRRQRGALLQHGGILLRQSEHTPNLPGIYELTGRSVRSAELEHAIGKAWEKHTGSALHLAEWTDYERHRCSELVRTKYSQPAWNAKR